MAIEPRPFKVRCARCHHAWTLATLPMEIMAFGEICKNAKCPSCGHNKQIHFDPSNESPSAPALVD